jgi:hypothetical protein
LNTKDEGSKQQGDNNLSKTPFNIGVHSEGHPNIYTRPLMSNDIKVLVWGRLWILLCHFSGLGHFGYWFALLLPTLALFLSV